MAHVVTVEGFKCLKDPWSYVVGAVCPWKVPSEAGERLPKTRKTGDGCALTRGVLGGISWAVEELNPIIGHRCVPN